MAGKAFGVPKRVSSQRLTTGDAAFGHRGNHACPPLDTLITIKQQAPRMDIDTPGSTGLSVPDADGSDQAVTLLSA